MLNSLILTDGPVENHPFIGVLRCAHQSVACDADAFAGALLRKSVEGIQLVNPA